MKVGDHVQVVCDDLEGWTGVIAIVFPTDPPSYSVDLDQEQDPEFNIAGLYFEEDELEVIE
ncbi:hypothetical protein 16Q_087 [Pseudomonas phage 16Q]|nr:hypothetical protein 16Q_087 [Pseudomonas phage 16Q]